MVGVQRRPSKSHRSSPRPPVETAGMTPPRVAAPGNHRFYPTDVACDRSPSQRTRSATRGQVIDAAAVAYTRPVLEACASRPRDGGNDHCTRKARRPPRETVTHLRPPGPLELRRADAGDVYP
jgi:hypothetical protein